MKNVKDILNFLCSTVKGVKNAQEDDKLTWTDAIYFKDAAMSLPAAIKDADKIDDEWRDRTPQDIEDLKSFIVDNFDIDDDGLEEWIEDGAALGIDFAEWIERGVKMFKKKDN